VNLTIILRTLHSYIKPLTIDSTHSKFNGDIEVVEYFGKREIVVAGLQQSGWLVRKIWDKALYKVMSYELKVTSVLILGLGGGSVVPVINRHYPKAKIVGIEIDPVMVEVGSKFLGFRKSKNLEVIVDDAFAVFTKKSKRSNHWCSRKYDLVVIDLYVGEAIPEKLKSDEFLECIKNMTTTNGIVLINHLRGHKYNTALHAFEKKLHSVFSQVTSVTPLVNKVFIAMR
jgi:spermidine synthase